jgi:immune inhibitor A
MEESYMQRKTFAVLSTLLIIVGLMLSLSAAAFAAPPQVNAEPDLAGRNDNKADPLTTRQQELKQQALNAKLNGKAYGKTHEVARGQYVQLELEGTGMVWTVMGEFSDFPHNSIAQPDRAVNNTTYWVPDFSKAHMDELLYDRTPGANSMANFYLEQSSGRYTIAGESTDWIPVGGHLMYDDNPDSNVWFFLRDTVNGWYNAQVAAGKTPAQINAYLAQFDVWDRYDYDGDGNFDEPDGYIDTFQSVHSGEGEEAGGGALGAEAIWSHSWYAFYNLIGIAGPSFNKLGGIQVGSSDYWVGKYTIQPENGGVGVFTHEYGHDLGLPDLYDYYGENGTGFWTLMSSGSWIDEGKDTIGNKPAHMGVWEKFQLGWLNYEVARAGVKSEHKLGPMEFNTKQAQGLFVILPKKEVVTQIATPYAGSYFYYSGMGDNLDNSMTKSFALPAGAALNAKVNFQIELDWDYAYLTVNGTPVATNLSTNFNPNGQNFGNGITGSSGGVWVNLTADLSAYAGQTVTLGFRYWTDGAAAETGFMVDEINITGFPTDGAEAAAGWTFAGFRTTTGTETALYNHYYVAEFRTYKGYDYGLKVGPYYFGYPAPKNNYVDHFAYQDGLLINYWDTSQADNNTGLHPGEGLLLPIDAHPQALKRCGTTTNWRNRIQTYDSTFTLAATDGIPNIHQAGVLCPVPSLPAVPVFDDSTTYYDPVNPLGSVIHPNTGTQVRIQSISAQDSFMQVEVRPAK